jgi:hypothetical protein
LNKRSKEWFYEIGGKLNPETGKCIYKKDHLKHPIEVLEQAHKDVEEGWFQPERENDELTPALGNKEHGGRTRSQKAPFRESMVFLQKGRDFNTTAE